MKKLLFNLVREEEGATALEYALLVVLIAIVMSLGAVIFGKSLSNLFARTGTKVDAVQPIEPGDATGFTPTG